MGKQHKHSNNRVSDFFDYLSGKLSGKDRNAFERRLQKDPFEAEAAEGFAKVSRDEAAQDVERVAGRIRNRIRRKRRIVWYSAAAAVASLMIVATVFFNVDDGSMDRYKIAPEFEEVAQEQPTGPVVEKKRTRKDAMPEAEELAGKDAIPEAEELRQEEDAITGAEQRVPAEKDAIPEAEQRVLAGKDAITGAEQRVPAEKDAIPEAEERLLAKKDAIPEAEELRQEEVLRQEELGQVLSTEKGEARVKDAAERSKRAAPAAMDEPAAMEFQQDEIPELEEIQPAQAKSLEEEIPKQAQAVTTGQAVDREQAVAESLQGRIAGVEIAQPAQDQVRETINQPTLEGQLSGIVYSADDLEPLPGVSLFIKGSTEGTVSDVHGRFSINTSEASGSTLVAAYIGMQTEEIPLDASQPMEIAMVPDAVQLEEVVVLGHAITKKTALTGSVSKVEPDPVTETEYITASPVDGIVAYKRYIDTTLVFPVEAESSEKEVVVLKFSVTPGGRPYNFRVVRSPGAPFTKEAIRAISAGPDWRPATRDGMYVDDDVRLRIVFRTDQ